MKNSFMLLFLMSFVAGSINAQCPGCAVDTNCATTLPGGGICPDVFPDATVGMPYDEDVTFYMPLMITDPGTGLDVELLEIEIIGVQGLPLNLQWECGNSPAGNCTYTPPSNPPSTTFGCIKFCGTPIVAPGTYPIIVNILADVYVPSIGATLYDQPQIYEADLEVLPGVGGNNSFSFTPTVGCEDLDVDFEAILDFSPGQPTEYAWDFGNGNTSTDKTPSTQTFGAGTYSVNLVTTVYNYVLTEVCISSVNDAWCGDAEEVQCNCGTPIIGQCPDIYVQLFDANSNAVYSATVVDEVTNVCWNGLSIILDNPPYTLSVYDNDPISNDDLLGTFPLTVNTTGTMNFSSADGTIGNFTVSQVVSSTFDDADTVYVNPTPAAPMISFDGASSISVDNPDAMSTYQWYSDGMEIVGETGTSLSVSTTGNYSVLVFNSFGCSTTSTDLMVIISSNKGIEPLGWTINSIFPNPANDKVVVEVNLKNVKEMQFSILDHLGRTVWKEQMFLQAGKNNKELDISALPNGFYFLEIKSDKERKTNKLVIGR